MHTCFPPSTLHSPTCREVLLSLCAGAEARPGRQAAAVCAAELLGRSAGVSAVSQGPPERYAAAQ